MKCNFKRQMQNQIAKDISTTSSTIKRIWELATLVTLHRYFDFDAEQLSEFGDGMHEVYSEMNERASATDKYDKKKRELTNLDTAVIFMIRELRRDGIDQRDILGDDEKIVMVDEDGKQTDLDEVVDNMERRGYL